MKHKPIDSEKKSVQELFSAIEKLPLSYQYMERFATVRYVRTSQSEFYENQYFQVIPFYKKISPVS